MIRSEDPFNVSRVDDNTETKWINEKIIKQSNLQNKY